MAGDAAIVRYRIAWWAIMSFAITLAGLTIAAAAAGALWEPARLHALVNERVTFATISEEQFDLFVAAAPVLLGAGAIGGVFFMLYWVTYVRRVRIGRESIHVWRGLRPFARRYPRSTESRILQMDRYVYLGEAGQPRLINPSMSPMLRSKEEARWVAWQMRRAMEQIGTSLM
jgi:hypothetical protein